MATQPQIEKLRLMLGPNVLDDATLAKVIDASESDDPLEWAALSWEAVAGRYHALVDISESGSSRKMSDLHKNALAMAGAYRKRIDAAAIEVVSTTGRTVTRRITRI